MRFHIQIEPENCRVVEKTQMVVSWAKYKNLCVEIEREREFYFTPAKPGCEHMAAASESGMSLRRRGESKVQACRPFYLSVVELFIQGRVLRPKRWISKEWQGRHS